MATTPTNLPVPSESPRDLKFNAGKIDEFVTSKQQEYIDRFGESHYTIEGLRWIAQQAISAFGYITMDSFQDGATLTLPNQILRWKLPDGDGEYYRWDGVFPKVVPAASTPESTGGIGAGKWLSVGDATLRGELEKYKYRTNGTSIYFVPNIDFDIDTDNRNACFSFSGTIYLPKDVKIRCNFLPEDDVRKFIGEGNIITTDPWGNEHMFDVYLSTKGGKFTPTNLIHQKLKRKGSENCTIGVIGDSISDGFWGKQTATSNPNTGAPNYNLSSTNYDHSQNGGSHSWVAHFGLGLNAIISRWTNIPAMKVYNASLNSMKLMDGWAYRNFDYGFFQNKAYNNSAPQVFLMAMGWNDINENNFDDYLDRFDQIIRKAWGYGCSVGLVTVNMNDALRTAQEGALKRTICNKYQNTEYFDLGNYLRKRSSEDIRFNRSYYIKDDGTFDTTHPQPLGQADIGNAMLSEVCKGTFIPSFKPNDKLLTFSSDKYWDCIGTSGVHYPITYSPSGGTPALDRMGYLAVVRPNSENIYINAIVFCEESGMSLTILEPYTSESDFTTQERGHNISVASPLAKTFVAPDDDAVRYIHKNELIGSDKLGTGKTLRTYVGALRYGLNVITIIYGGSPTRAYIPTLIFGKYIQSGVKFENVRLSVSKTTPRRFISRNSNEVDLLTSNVFDGTPFSEMPEWMSSGAKYTGCLSVNEPLAELSGVVINYNSLNGNGVAIRRNNQLLEICDMENNNLTGWISTGVDGTAELKIYFNQTASGVGGVIISIIGSSVYEGTFNKTGGVIGVFNSNTDPKIFNLSLNVTNLGA